MQSEIFKVRCAYPKIWIREMTAPRIFSKAFEPTTTELRFPSDLVTFRFPPLRAGVRFQNREVSHPTNWRQDTKSLPTAYTPIFLNGQIRYSSVVLAVRVNNCREDPTPEVIGRHFDLVKKPSGNG